MSETLRRCCVPAALLLALWQPGCVPKPKVDYTPDQIKSIDALEELMRVQSVTMDPLFAKRRQTTFTDADYGAMVDAAAKVQSGAAALRERFAQNRRPSFATFSEQLGAEATQLKSAAEGKQADKAAAALSAIKETCSGCHKEYR